jgi:hypothetical protein
LFDLDGYSASMSVFSGWSRAPSTRVSTVAGFLVVCASSTGVGSSTVVVFSTVALSVVSYLLRLILALCFVKLIASIWLGDLHPKGIFVARCIDLRLF